MGVAAVGVSVGTAAVVGVSASKVTATARVPVAVVGVSASEVTATDRVPVAVGVAV
jgi:hypothetical protein